MGPPGHVLDRWNPNTQHTSKDQHAAMQAQSFFNGAHPHSWLRYIQLWHSTTTYPEAHKPCARPHQHYN